jgi:2-polyprenyl-6-methoxyphenol hydroxylase-like FAD-dependent oxidoreductase
LEDAWVLASALKTTGELQDALRAYEQRRAPRVRRVSRLAESERTNRPPNPLLSTAARLVPTAIASRAYARLVCSFSSVLNDERIVDQ